MCICFVAEKLQKLQSGWGGAPDPDGGAYGAPPYPLAGRDGATPPPAPTNQFHLIASPNPPPSPDQPTAVASEGDKSRGGADGDAPGRVREGGTPPVQLGGMGERCELPHRGLGRSPRSQRFLRKKTPPKTT